MRRTMRFSTAAVAAELPSGADENVGLPLDLVRAVIEEHCPPGGTVLDPFAGFGTTLAVAAELGRSAVGIELDLDRTELIRRRVAGHPAATVVHGDARELARLRLSGIDLCLTSPPYMNAVDHPQNPLTAYTTLDGHYPTYLAELAGVFAAVADLLRPGGHLAVSAAVIRTGDALTPLAWDIACHLAARLTFREIVDVEWDDPPTWLEADYCLLFEKPK